MNKIWDSWRMQGIDKPIYACDKHMAERVQELKKGKNRLYCVYCGSWWKTHPKRGVLRHTP